MPTLEVPTTTPPAQLWQPTPPPPRHPAVLAGLEKAAELRAQGEQLSADADALTMRSKLTGQRIESLQREKTELLNRITAAEGRDCKAELARNEARFFDLYGKTGHTFSEIADLNTCVQSFSWLPLLEKKLLALAKALKVRLGEIDAALAELESTK